MKSDLKFYANMELVIWLLEILERPVTVHYIADKTAICTRSVYRWLDHLREMGFKVEDHKGRYIIIDGNNRMRALAYKLMNLCYPNTSYQDIKVLHQIRENTNLQSSR